MGRHLVAMMLGLATGRPSVGDHRGREAGRPEDDPVGTFWEWVEVELERARRYEHALAMLRFPLGRDGVEADQASCEAALRSTDRWCVIDGDLLVLAPETDRTGAEDLACRLRRDVDWLALGAANVACFPTDALTRHGLEVALCPGSPRWARFPDTSAARAS